jgi:uncharacterized protein YjeT (DUF2065 family)
MMLEFIKEHKMVIVTVIYSIISLYVLFSQTPKSFEKYSLITNILLLFGLFIMLMYTLIPQATTSSWLYITLAIIASTAAFYGMFNVPMISDGLTLLFNMAIVGGAAYLIYKYVIKGFLNINVALPSSMPHITMNPIAIAIFLSLIVAGVVKWLYPKAERKMEGGGQLVLNEPVYLNTLRNIGDYKELNKLADGDDTHNYHYSVSFWTFIHSQPGRNKYTPIFNYGEKPVVEYNPKKQQIRVRVAKKTIYEGTVLPQRWTNFVITYDRGIVDVFIDAKLVATEGGVVPYMTYDTMTVGENNGVSGGIGYVKYYDTPVRKDTIDYNYNKFRQLNGRTLF